MPLVVQGLAGMQRAFAVADKALAKETREALRDVAEPIRADAELLAVSRISKIGIPWSRMRVGVTRRSVYVAPKQRNAGGTKRPNFAGVLMGRAMRPALEQNVDQVEDRFERMLDTVGRDWEHA